MTRRKMEEGVIFGRQCFLLIPSQPPSFNADPVLVSQRRSVGSSGVLRLYFQFSSTLDVDELYTHVSFNTYNKKAW